MKHFSRSDVGLVRENNQDSWVTITNKSGDILAAVCDGIGGAKAGDVASSLVCQKLEDNFMLAEKFSSLLMAKRWLKQTFNKINAEVYDISLNNEEYRGMGTTLVCCICTDEGLIVGNVGDSRCYELLEDNFNQITSDNTVVNDMVAKGLLTVEMAENHPKRHILSNAVGVIKNTKIDFYLVNKKADLILLCSDGLNGMVNNEGIKNVLISKDDIEIKGQHLIDLAKSNGGYDNITIVLLERDNYGTN